VEKYRVVKSSRQPAKIGAYLVSIGRLLRLVFLYGWRFLNEISLDLLLNDLDNLHCSRLLQNFLTALEVFRYSQPLTTF